MKLALALVLGSGCVGGSPLVESGPQVELTADPGNVLGGPLIRLELTTWNHLAVLGDATASGQIVATRDGDELVLDDSTGYRGNNDSYIAAFIPTTERSRTDHPASSIVTVTDHDTTWTVTIPNLLTNDLQPSGPLVANQPDTFVWPSAASPDPWSTIDWACIDVANDSACHYSDEVHDPGITIEQQYVHVDVPANAGDDIVVTGQRFVNPTASNGPTFFISILNRTSANFE
jgi:hypothetical protein